MREENKPKKHTTAQTKATNKKTNNCNGQTNKSQMVGRLELSPDEWDGKGFMT